MSDEKAVETVGGVEHPLDGWIRLALYTDKDTVNNLRLAVSEAVRRLKWEMENMPSRWVNVRRAKELQLAHWVGLQDKLYSLWDEMDGIPF